MERVVIITGFHDYRTGRRGSIQHIADAFVRLGYDTTFISTRFSTLSLMTRDSRNFLWNRANKPESINGVQCYLWRTLVHPFHSRFGFLNALTAKAFPLYAHLPNRFVDDAIRRASYVVIESGLSVIFLRRARALNPSAKIIYRASDKLDTVGAHPALQVELERCKDIIDHICLLAAKMAPYFTFARDRIFAVHLGVHPLDFANIGPNPYSPGLNAVAVGSGLFDPEFFLLAAARFPEVQFHVIGCGTQFDAPKNVHIYDEMSFKETLPFIKHAAFGIAPFRKSANAEYLSQSSLKLMQYEFLGIPAVCPDFAVGDNHNRFGFRPGDQRTIENAVKRAIDRIGRVERQAILTWDDVARRILDPRRFPDTYLSGSATLEHAHA
jgi:2-beta-glucuronyltransferase